MNDPIDRHLQERTALERGFSRGLGVSVGAHILILGLAIGVPMLRPAEPLLRIQEGFAVPLPPGGRGVPSAQAAREGASREAPPAPTPSIASAAEPPKVLKPPKDEARKGLAMPDAKSAKKPAQSGPSAGPPRPTLGLQQPGAPAGTGSDQATPGIAFAPEGPGVPGGTDLLGDWYMAGVQRKIWTIWTQQLKAAQTQPVTVSFAILADGSVADIRVIQSSGAFLLDLAAQRAISSGAPFGPLPKSYETNRITIQAIFKPTS